MRYVVVGEALIDLIAQPGSGEDRRWAGRSGGSPMNVATGLGNLGADIQFLGRLSRDPFGSQLTEHLKRHHVGLDLAVKTSDPTTLAVVALDDTGKASYTFYTAGTSNFGWTEEELPQLPEDVWLHFGSIGAFLEPSFDVVRRFVSSAPVRKSFDLNIRPTIISERDEYLRKVHSYLELLGGDQHVVKASDEDVEWLTQGDAIKGAQRWCATFGLEHIILTLGGEGVAVVTGEGVAARHPGFRVDVVDTVGAGDTFMAGFLKAFPDKGLEAALEYGSAAAAIVCTRAGAQPPTAAEVEAFLG